jgi:hypothetical protein
MRKQISIKILDFEKLTHKINKTGKADSIMDYIYFPNAAYAILYTTLVLAFIYCR